MILRCVCSHKFQDERYGEQMRVYNPCKDGSCRCTICGTKRRIGEDIGQVKVHMRE